MPRRARNVAAMDGQVVHVLNRGNCRMNLFDKDGDFAAGGIPVAQAAESRSSESPAALGQNPAGQQG